MAIKRGDKVAVITRTLCRYEGNYLSMNVEEQTFTLGNVRAFGTENRPADDFFPGSQSIYECVEFNAADVQDLSVVDYHGLRDPAIVNMGEQRRGGNFERSSLDYFRGRPRESNARNRNYSQGQRSYGNGNSNRHFRNEWIGVSSQSEGSFPQRNPGAQGNSMEEFDFEKGIAEFTQLKLDESVEEVDTDKQSPGTSPEKKTPEDGEPAVSSYDMQKSFFDNLSAAPGMAPRKPQSLQRMKNPNVETFGLDTVKQFHEYRRYTSDQRSGYRNRGFLRRNNGYNENMSSQGSRNRQNLGPFQNAMKFHQ